jgi:hypothetical protein
MLQFMFCKKTKETEHKTATSLSFSHLLLRLVPCTCNELLLPKQNMCMSRQKIFSRRKIA